LNISSLWLFSQQLRSSSRSFRSLPTPSRLCVESCPALPPTRHLFHQPSCRQTLLTTFWTNPVSTHPPAVAPQSVRPATPATGLRAAGSPRIGRVEDPRRGAQAPRRVAGDYLGHVLCAGADRGDGAPGARDGEIPRGGRPGGSDVASPQPAGRHGAPAQVFAANAAATGRAIGMTA